MATIQRINIIGSREGSRNRRRLKANQTGKKFRVGFKSNISTNRNNLISGVVSVGADIAFDADPKFFACLVRFESSSVPTTLPTAYDVYPLDGRHDGGYYTVKDCVTIDVLPR